MGSLQNVENNGCGAASQAMKGMLNSEKIIRLTESRTFGVLSKLILLKQRYLGVWQQFCAMSQ